MAPIVVAEPEGNKGDPSKRLPGCLPDRLAAAIENDALRRESKGFRGVVLLDFPPAPVIPSAPPYERSRQANPTGAMPGALESVR